MFRGLRWRLTLLYLLVATMLVALIGGGAYQLLTYYFQSSTDLALQHVMSYEFRLLSLPLPSELAAADASWYASRERITPTPRQSGSEDEVGESEHISSDDFATEQAFDGQLASVFVMPLTADGELLFRTGPQLPIEPDAEAMKAALTQGRDWRIVRADDGSRVRLLTYRLEVEGGPAVLQLGRKLTDQDRVLSQLLFALLGLSAFSVVLLGAGSWWLAGRSLAPAQRAWERQQTFISNASHELRTPLTLMRASAEVALRELPAADEDGRALLGDVLQETDHMNRLVEDLLLLSRLDAGRLSLEHKAISMPDLLTDVERQMGRVAEERGVKLMATFAPAAGTVLGDFTRLRQVLLILLDNALRHTPRGGEIHIESHQRGRQLQIVVADTGRGIPPEHLPRVFERFYRADSARTAGAGDGGAGLGLSIAQALVQAHHGQISIESRPGKGTRVNLLLPLAG
ncbi:MAG: histidine kinase [Chloroflexi bacterium]|nr:histidine kinase [Chloroflexota bacterium]